ncbi:thioredoxin domain-containing protein [Vagococcus elongatus]|uniref:Thioredoxin-like fold domain-containing protein n=1 Tax=Vagococcus elongatus TaxID=180344 RepID=A0A430AX63_9ENTE|nr:thioredoxin domain-containing protein [Vagococcus elongatus]RSU12634.1 hypothetical protein CBF29_05765 [Vagococcus elongatus]
MEIIEVSKISDKIGIQLGDENAPVVVMEYVNLRCPYCLQWFEDSRETYHELIENGTVRKVLKLFDKEKFGLHYGNVLHRYVPKHASYEEVDAVLDKIYHSQTRWGEMNREMGSASVAEYAEKILHLTEDADEEMSQAIIDETISAGVQFVPTMVVGDHVFDQKISQEEFRQLIEEEKQKQLSS